MPFKAQNNMEIYLDNSATTRCLDEVVSLMDQIYLSEYGNPSSMHTKGVEAEKYLRNAKETIARNLRVLPKEIYFTSGGTESDNLALIGTAMANRRFGNHLITTRIEHPAVLQTMKYLEGQGFRVTYLPVDKYGVISLEDLRKAVCRETILVSIMHTNNEIGALQPVAEAAALVKSMKPSVVFHVDAVQGFGKFRIYPRKMGIDLMSVSGHKIHGPKGVGFLYVSERVKIAPILWGGGQQGGMRSGTENLPGIVGMAEAVRLLYQDLDRDVERLYRLKERFIKGIEAIDRTRVNGHTGYDSAPHIVNVSFLGVRAQVLLNELSERGIYISAGSACAAHKHTDSQTLTAIGLKQEYMDAAVRFSFSVYTTEEEINKTLEALAEVLPVLRRYTRK